MCKVAPGLGKWIRRTTAAAVIAGFVPSACLPAWAGDIFAQTATQQADTVESWIAQLDSPNEADRKTAADALASLGREAASAVRPLSALLHDKSGTVRAAGARALWLIEGRTEDTLAVLTELLVFGEPKERQIASYVLGTMGQPAKPALPALRKAMRSNFMLVRVHAAEAVSRISPEDREAVQTLITSLTDQNPDVRATAATALGDVPPSDRQRVSPALVTALSDESELVRTAAEVALMSFNNEAPVDNNVVEADAEQTPEEIVTADSESSPAEAIGNPFAMLEATETTPAPETPAEPQPTETVEAPLESAFGELPAEPAVEELPMPTEVPVASTNGFQPETDLSQPSSTVQPLDLSQQDLPDELRQAIVNLTNIEPRVRQEAAIKISWLGQKAAAAAPMLLELVGDENDAVSAHIAKAIYDVDPSLAEHSVSTLTDLLHSVQPGNRSLAAYFLGQIGEASKPALPTLKRIAESSEGMDRLHLAEALTRIAPTDGWAADVLLNALTDPNAEVRVYAAYALGEMAPHHSDRIVPQLLAATEDQHEDVRTAADLSLAEFPMPTEEDLLAKFADANTTPSEGAIPSESPAEVGETPVGNPFAENPFANTETPATPEVESTETPVDNPFEENAFAQINPPAPSPVGSVTLPGTNRGATGEFDDRLKPITSLTANIAPRMRDDDGKRQQLPSNYGARYLAGKGKDYSPRGRSRPWMITSVQYAASGVCHRPLYFEEVNLERYGHNWCMLQPAVSAAAFFGRVPLLPYMIGAEPPCECRSDLGYYRPGSCAPFQKHCMPWSLKGGLLQAGVTTGLFFAIY